MFRFYLSLQLKLFAGYFLVFVGRLMIFVLVLVCRVYVQSQSCYMTV